MIFVVTIAAAAIALVLHAAGWAPFGDPVTIPVSGAVAMCAMGVMARFIPARRRGLVAMVPPAIPAREMVVLISGVCELAGGIGVLIPPLRPWAAACLVLFLLAVFPANVHQAHQRGDQDGTYLRRVLVRGGEQVAFVALCLWILIAAVA
ncbi:MAG: hypothetical protein QM638_02160 [Nocardioides sp.]|uniref:DoxX family protein n=1 Tax=Nocardioides sp. TaxID=35761 RepID=UPI0039E5677B